MPEHVNKPEETLLDIVMTGRPSLLTALRAPEMRQLKQRVAGYYTVGGADSPAAAAESAPTPSRTDNRLLFMALSSAGLGCGLLLLGRS